MTPQTLELLMSAILIELKAIHTVLENQTVEIHLNESENPNMTPNRIKDILDDLGIDG